MTMLEYCTGEGGKTSRSKGLPAFTLAEVLITLGIIGVVAAMTLPTLINNHRKQETIAKLKKVYSVLGQASLLAQAEYGETSGWELDSGKSRAKSKNFSEKYLIPYLEVVKKCEDYSSTSDCNYPIYYLKGQRYSANDFNNWTYRFYLADGTFLIVYSLYDSNEAKHTKYASIIFDINGEKRPNKWGIDVFKVEYILQTKQEAARELVGKMVPPYINRNSRTTLLGTGESGFCNKSKEGIACLAVILMDGWEIKDDYPWQ